MSQSVAQVGHEPHYVMVPVMQSNGLGVAGFFIALIGLFIPTGIVALLGLLISLVALGRPPRAFAAIGVFIGLLGTVFWLLVTGAVVLGAITVGIGVVALSAAAFIFTQPEIIEVTSDMGNVLLAVAEYEEEEDALPQDLAILGLGVSTLTDPWGKRYRYTIVDEEPGFDVVSSGGDGLFDTADDLAFSRLDRIWQNAFASFGEKIEDLCGKLKRLQDASGHNGQYYRFSKGRGHDGRAFQYEARAKEAAQPGEEATTATPHAEADAPPPTVIAAPALPLVGEAGAAVEAAVAPPADTPPMDAPPAEEAPADEAPPPAEDPS